MWASSTLRVLLTKVRPIIGRGGALVASGSVLQCPSRITGAVAVPNDPSSTRKLIATESSRFHGMGFFTFLSGGMRLIDALPDRPGPRCNATQPAS